MLINLLTVNSLTGNYFGLRSALKEAGLRALDVQWNHHSCEHIVWLHVSAPSSLLFLMGGNVTGCKGLKSKNQDTQNWGWNLSCATKH